MVTKIMATHDSYPTISTSTSPLDTTCNVTGNDYYPTYDWQDITSNFFEACDELHIGELAFNENFGLFDAMSAIEMMDPKMDAGMLCNQAKRKVYSFSEAVEKQEIKVNDVSYTELIGIMDDSLSALVTWLEGHSLAQTVFINLYLHNPALIVDSNLKAFCFMILKVVDQIRDQVNRACVFEEEDFQSLTYGFKLAGEYSDAKVTAMLKECEEDVNRVVKSTRSRFGVQRDESTEREHQLSLGVYSRLKFCRLLFTTLNLFEKDCRDRLEEATKPLHSLLDLLNTITVTAQYGIVPTTFACSPNDYPSIMGFDPLINQRLLPPTFPRYVKIQSRDSAHKYMTSLCQNLLKVTEVGQIINLHDGLDFFIDFNWSVPCVLSRSILKLTFLPNNRRMLGDSSFTEAIKETLRGFILPPVLMSRGPLLTNGQAKEFLEVFLGRCIVPFTQLFQSTCHNRARQRDRWARMLEDFNNLQDEADRIDAALHTLLQKVDTAQDHLANFGTWILYHVLCIMKQYVLCGFELELYAPHEYHYIYWYLYECIMNWLITTVTRADKFLCKHHEFMQAQNTKANKKKCRKKRSDNTTHVHLHELVHIQGLQQLFVAYYKAVMGMMISGKIRMPQYEFDNEEVRYNHRFAPFEVLTTPPPISYSRFQDVSDYRVLYERDIPPEYFYSAALKHFNQARSLLESITTKKNGFETIIKVIKMNVVVMGLLSKGHKREDPAPATFDFSIHKLYPIVRI